MALFLYFLKLIGFAYNSFGILVAILFRQRRRDCPGCMLTSLQMKSHGSINNQEIGDLTMKFYIAGYSGCEPDDMDYKKLGGDKELYDLFPELKTVIKRYTIKNIDVRFSNGDRLRIYDIYNGRPQSFGDTVDHYDAHPSFAAACYA